MVPEGGTMKSSASATEASGVVRRMDYVPVRPKLYPKSRDALSVDARFWRSFKVQKSERQIAAVSDIHFCPAPPHDFAVTSSTRVTIYDGKTREVKKNISRFGDVAYSGTFRADGQLIVAGGETGIIQVFDAGSRTILRQLKGHRRAVHWVRYSLQDKLHVLSASDDNSVRWWDVASEVALLKMEEHKDYVRCGASSPSSADVWASGSYDHSVLLWDLRTSKSVLQIQHGAPLEDVIFFPSGGMLATAGGNVVKIWDVLGGGKLLHSLGSHLKTVTKLCLTTPSLDGSAGTDSSPRLLSASLDGHVKVFELEHFKVTHAAKYPDALLSMDVSPECRTMAVGSSSGMLTIRHRVKGLVDKEGALVLSARPLQPGLEMSTERARDRPLNPNNHRYFLRGRAEKPSEGDYYLAKSKRPNLTKYDKFLRKFRYKDALTAALCTSDPKIVVAVMEELVARRGLGRALSNWDDKNVELLVMFLCKQATLPKYSKILIPVSLKVLDIYEKVFVSIPSILKPIKILREKVLLETRLLVAMQSIQGVVESLRQTAAQN